MLKLNFGTATALNERCRDVGERATALATVLRGVRVRDGGEGGPVDGGGEADWPSQPKPGGCWPSSEAKGPAALERAVGEAAAAAATRRV